MSMSIIIYPFIFSYITCQAFRYLTETNSLVSCCDHCQKPLKWFEKIPILSFLFLKGKCSHCSQPIAQSFFVLEVFGLLFGLFFYLIPHSFNAQITLLIFVYIFLCDFYHQLIPDRTHLPLLLLNIRSISISSIIYLTLLSFILVWYAKQDKFGFGDIKLIWSSCISIQYFIINTILLTSSILTLVLMLVLKRKTQPFPFGCSWVVSYLFVIHLLGHLM